MAMAGIDLPTLKELAGHSQIQMTMRYVHPTPEHKRAAIERFELYVQKEQTTTGQRSNAAALALVASIFPRF